MSKELRELLAAINNKKADARKLIAENKLEEAEAMKNEVVNMQKKFDLLKDLYEEEEEGIENKINNDEGKFKNKIVNATGAFLNAFKSIGNKAQLSNEEVEILNATTMTEGVPGDGGLTVPKDVKTEIKELRRAGDALENYVNIEPVTTLSGTRVVEVDAESVPFDNIDEEADFPDMEAPQLVDVNYTVKKKGGTLAFTKELFSDTAENIKAFIKKWVSKKSRATRNALIIKCIEDNFATTKKAIVDTDDLKDIFDVELDPTFETSSIMITNQDGYNYLNKLKDSQGNYMLQKDPTQPTRRLFDGKYPIIKMSNKTLKTVLGKAPVYCGDLKEAITIFDRETLFIEFSEQAGDLWKKDKVGMKVRERLDVKAVDKKALVVGEITIPA